MDRFVVSLPRGSSSTSTGKRKTFGTPSSSSSGNNGGSSGGSSGGKLARAASGESQQAPSRPLSQMFLDLGQKSFGASKQCTLCGMLFVIGDVDDEKRHQSFCSKTALGPTLASAKGFSTLATFDEGRDVVIAVKGGQKRWHQPTAVDAILKVVQAELGSELDFASEAESVLLYLRGKSVLGCLVIEGVHPSKLVTLSATKTSTEAVVSTDDKENMHVRSQADEGGRPKPNNVALGIKLVWVLGSSRRQGVAGRLIDTSRRTFEFGRIVNRDHVAFSQPTTDGLAMALAYSRSDCVWGYA